MECLTAFQPHVTFYATNIEEFMNSLGINHYVCTTYFRQNITHVALTSVGIKSQNLKIRTTFKRKVLQQEHSCVIIHVHLSQVHRHMGPMCKPLGQ